MKRGYSTPKKLRERAGGRGGDGMSFTSSPNPSSTQTTPSLSDTPSKEEKQIPSTESQSKINILINRAESLMAKLSTATSSTTDITPAAESKITERDMGNTNMSTKILTFQPVLDNRRHISPQEMEVSLLLEGLPEAYEDPFQTYVNNEYVDNILHSVGQYLPNQLHFKSFAVYNQEVMERLREVRYLQVDLNSLLVYSTKFGVQFDNTYLLVKYVHQDEQGTQADVSNLPIKIDLTAALEAKLKQKYRVNLKARSGSNTPNSTNRLLNRYFAGSLDLPNTYITLPINITDDTIQRWFSGASYVQVELWSYIHTTHSVKKKEAGKGKGESRVRGGSGGGGRGGLVVEEGERVAHCIPFATTKVYLSGLLYTYQDRTYNSSYREEGEVHAAHHHLSPDSLPSPPSLPPSSLQHSTKNVCFDATINTELVMVGGVYQVVSQRYEVLKGVGGTRGRSDRGGEDSAKVMCGIMNVRMKLLSDGAYVQHTDQVVVINSLIPHSNLRPEVTGRGRGEGRPMLQPLAPPPASIFADAPSPPDPIQRARDFVPQEIYYPTPLPQSTPPSMYLGMVFLGVQDVFIPPSVLGDGADISHMRLVIMYRLTKSTVDSISIPLSPNQLASPDGIYSFEVMQGKVGIYTHQQQHHQLPVFEVWIEYAHNPQHQLQRKLIGYTAAVLPQGDEAGGDGDGPHNSSNASCTHTLPIANIHQRFQYSGCIEVVYLPSYSSVYDLRRDMDYILQCMQSSQSALPNHDSTGGSDVIHDGVYSDDDDNDQGDCEGSVVSEDSLIDSPVRLLHAHAAMEERSMADNANEDSHNDAADDNSKDHDLGDSAFAESVNVPTVPEVYHNNEELTHILDISIHSICDDVYSALVGEDVFSQQPIRGMYVCYALTCDGNNGGSQHAPCVVVKGDDGNGDGLNILYGDKTHALYWDAECMILNTTNRHLFSTTSSLTPDTLSQGLGADVNVGIKFLLIPASPEGDLPVYSRQPQKSSSPLHTQYLSPVATATLSCADLCTAIAHLQSHRLTDYIIPINLVGVDGAGKTPFSLPIKVAYREQPVLARSLQGLPEPTSFSNTQAPSTQRQDTLSALTSIQSPPYLPTQSTGIHLQPATIPFPMRKVYININQFKLLESILKNHHSVYMFSSIFYTVQVVYNQPEYNQTFENVQFASQLYPIRSNVFQADERATLSIYLDGQNLAECTILIYIYLRHSLFPTPEEGASLVSVGNDDGRTDVEREIKERIQHTERLLHQYDAIMSTGGGIGVAAERRAGEHLDVVRASDTTLGYTAVPLHPHLFLDGAYEGWHHIITYTYSYNQMHTFSYTNTLSSHDKDAVYHAQSIGQMYVGVHSGNSSCDKDIVDGSNRNGDGAILPPVLNTPAKDDHESLDEECEDGDVSDLLDLRAMEYEGLRHAMRELDDLKSKLRGEVRPTLPILESSNVDSHAPQHSSQLTNPDVDAGSADGNGEDPFLGLSMMKGTSLPHNRNDTSRHDDGMESDSIGAASFNDDKRCHDENSVVNRSLVDDGSLSYEYDMDFEQSSYHNLPDIGDEGDAEEVYVSDFESVPASSQEPTESAEVQSNGDSVHDMEGDSSCDKLAESSRAPSEDNLSVDGDGGITISERRIGVDEIIANDQSDSKTMLDDSMHNAAAEVDAESDAASEPVQRCQSPVEEVRGEGADAFRQSEDSAIIFHASFASVESPHISKQATSLLHASEYSIHTPLSELQVSHTTHTATPLGVHLVDQAVGTDCNESELSLTDESVQVSLDSNHHVHPDDAEASITSKTVASTLPIAAMNDVSAHQQEAVTKRPPSRPASPPSGAAAQEEMIAELVRKQVLEILKQEATKHQTVLKPASVPEPAASPAPVFPSLAVNAEVLNPPPASAESTLTYLPLSQLPERSSRLLAECGADADDEVEGDMNISHTSSAGSASSTTTSSSAARSTRLQELVQRSISALHPLTAHPQTAKFPPAVQMKFPGQQKRFVDQETERVSLIMRGLLHKKA